MNPVHEWPVDPALLPVLEALLRERSVTRAAARLNLTQPSVSHALARLRAALGDPLLVRVGRELRPTPRAEALTPALMAALAAMREALSEGAEFDAAKCARRFVLASPDLFAALLPPLIERFAREAPRARLESRSLSLVQVLRAFDEGEVDLVVGPTRDAPPGSVRSVLGAVSFVVLAREGHPALARRDTLTLESWTRYGHIVVHTDSGPNALATQLREKKIARTVGFVAPTFLVAPLIVAQTDLFYLAPSVLVKPWAAKLGVRMLAPPIEIEPLSVAMYWSERVDSDRAHRWFRQSVRSVIDHELRGDSAPKRPRKRPARARS